MRCLLILITFDLCLYSVNAAPLPIDPRFQSIFNRVQRVSKFFNDESAQFTGPNGKRLSSE